MAHPAFIVEQLVCQFLNQWHVGLQPTLHLKARSNGAIIMNYDLTASLAMPQCSVRIPTGPNHTSRNRSRRRRRLRRSENSSRNSTRTPASAADNLDDTTSSDVQTVTISPVTSSTTTSTSNCDYGQSRDYCSISESQLVPPQLSNESINLISTGPQPPQLLQGDVEVLDFGLSGEVMQNIDEYLYVDPSLSPQTLANFACGFNVLIMKIQQYIGWKQSQEHDVDSFSRNTGLCAEPPQTAKK